MTIIYHTPTELIAALRATAVEAEQSAAHDDGFRAQRLGGCVAGMRQAADMLEKISTRTAATATTVITKPKIPDLVDLRPQFPEVADLVSRACAAWPGDFSSIAVGLMDGHTNMQPNAAGAIASLILLLQNVGKSPMNLSAALEDKDAQARAWRVQQGDHPQWSMG
jgi:hypothetical protein